MIDKLEVFVIDKLVHLCALQGIIIPSWCVSETELDCCWKHGELDCCWNHRGVSLFISMRCREFMRISMISFEDWVLECWAGGERNRCPNQTQYFTIIYSLHGPFLKPYFWKLWWWSHLGHLTTLDNHASVEPRIVEDDSYSMSVTFK